MKDRASKEKYFIKMYLEWWNDFLTVSYFADYHGITESSANRIINIARALYNRTEV